MADLIHRAYIDATAGQTPIPATTLQDGKRVNMAANQERRTRRVWKSLNRRQRASYAPSELAMRAVVYYACHSKFRAWVDHNGGLPARAGAAVELLLAFTDAQAAFRAWERDLVYASDTRAGALRERP